MAVLVKKFGGSSVATPEKIYRLVDRVLREKRRRIRSSLWFPLWEIPPMIC